MGQKIMNFCGLWGAAGIVQLRGESSQPLVLPQCLAGPSGLGEAGSEVGCRHWPKTQLTTKTTARRSHPGNSAEDQGCAAGNSFAALTPPFQGKYQQLSALSRRGAFLAPWGLISV